ncbi:hypothetical protein E3N88_41041 [Mikania micrantha]|uniref:Serine-threonine/tyrosine-protein kinase catalytic domain-containing protein n=1 Tax=Mikania micrantha TaxID=192012 RepID=A0A5N6LPG0_9ASTR|nr:hypothetical protein E3N88_41041 [Mikania micrantha]
MINLRRRGRTTAGKCYPSVTGGSKLVNFEPDDRKSLKKGVNVGRDRDTSIDEEQCNLARWTQESIKEGRLKQIIDTNIRETIPAKCLKDFAKLADRCLHSDPKKRPTMTEVVAGLVFVLALQEKANKTLVGGGMMIFGRRVPMFVFPSNGKSSVESGGLYSLKLFSDIVGDESRIPYHFDYDTIYVATDGFSDANIIPQSAFASMYKGMLESGQRIGIARPYTGSACGSSKDVLSLLVKDESENGDVALRLQQKSEELEREYMAPEYKFHGRLSIKSDVFSFGMLILKTISGCRTYNDIPAANKNFLKYAWTNWWTGTYSDIVDPRIDADSTSIRSFIHIGLLCTQPNAIDRQTNNGGCQWHAAWQFISYPPYPRKFGVATNYRRAIGLYKCSGSFIIN